MVATDWLKNQGAKVQFAIHDEDGQLGTVWTEYQIDDVSLLRRDLIWLERFPLDVAPIRMKVDSTFRGDGVLDELTVDIQNRNVIMELHGERFHKSFSFTLESGPFEKAFKIPLTDGGAISAGFSPFGQLTNMTVGDRWRVQVFNPIAALTGMGAKFIPILVEVTGRETLVATDGTKECLVVESPSAKAWVDDHGAVQMQELVLPGFGKLRMVRASVYDADARAKARSYRFDRDGGRGFSWNP